MNHLCKNVSCYFPKCHPVTGGFVVILFLLSKSIYPDAFSKMTKFSKADSSNATTNEPRLIISNATSNDTSYATNTAKNITSNATNNISSNTTTNATWTG